ncbi:MAG TPA: ComEC/Rec2 family competence protein [Acidobacteriaceae bacterium]
MRAFGAAKFWLDDPPPVETLRLRRAPLLAAAMAFAAGELLAMQWQFTIILVVALAFLLLLAIVAMHKAQRIAPLPILAFWAVAGCWCAQMQPWPAPQTALLQNADGLSRMVRGHVVRVRPLPATRSSGEPDRFEPGAWESEGTTPAESVDLDVQQVEHITPDVAKMKTVSGGVRITVLDGTPALQCGDVLEIPLRLREPERYRDAGAWSYTDELLREGIAVEASVKAARIQKVGDATRSLRCRAYAAQAWAAARMNALASSPANRILPRAARLTPDDTAMLNAMLFGDRSGLRQDLRIGFERTGSFHLFVVSGMHVALLAGMLFWALRKLRATHGIATVITIAITAAYAMLTGFGVPVQRALLMTAVFLAARWLTRNISVLQALGAAALAVLVWDPRAITEASFQMTFLVLIAVGGLAMPIAERTIMPRLRAARDLDAAWLDARLPPHLAQMRVMLRLFGNALAALFGRRARYVPALAVRAILRAAELILVSVIIEACMALPMAVYFHRATPFALPANLVAIPLVGLLAPLAVLTFCASLISTWFAALPAAATALVLHGVGWAIAHLSHMRFADTRVPAPAAPVIIGVIATVAFACWAVRKRSRWIVATGIIALALVPLATLWPEKPLLHPDTLEITALDVGQGDSLLVVSPDGHTLLVDAGGPVGQAELASSNSARWDVGEEVVAPYLWSRRLRHLDVVLLTHAHSDHMGGMPAILRDFHPRELWVSVDPGNSADYRSLLALAAGLGIQVRHFHAGDGFAWGGVRASVLAPEATYANANTPVNDDSLVMRLDFGKSSALLEGDAERRSEDTMLANNRIAPVTLLKIGHHGSKTSTNPEFLSAAAPKEAVISSGRRNTFGHPRPEILQRLEEAHVKTFRTDRQGATTFLLAADGHVTTQSATQ